MSDKQLRKKIATYSTFSCIYQVVPEPCCFELWAEVAGWASPGPCRGSLCHQHGRKLISVFKLFYIVHFPAQWSIKAFNIFCFASFLCKSYVVNAHRALILDPSANWNYIHRKLLRITRLFLCATTLFSLFLDKCGSQQQLQDSKFVVSHTNPYTCTQIKILDFIFIFQVFHMHPQMKNNFNTDKLQYENN